MSTENTKICIDCKREKRVADFYKGYSSCKSCTLKKNKVYREKNVGKIKRWAKNSRIRRRDKNLLYQQQYREGNKEKIKVMNRNWRIKYLKKYPWLNSWVNMKNRCRHSCCKSYPNYGGRGIKLLITFEEVGKLWYRDKAYLLKYPSIDRKDSNGNYTYENCRFIELSLNQSNGGKNRYRNRLERL